MEIRSFSEAPKIADGRTIEGYAVVFGRESKVMYDQAAKRFFVEVIEKGAITEASLRTFDIKAVVEHNKQRLLARSVNGVGSLSLTVDDYGLKYRFDAPNTVDGDYIVEMVKRGDITGSSFTFWADEKNITYSKNLGTTRRSIKLIDRIFDVSPVADPAYSGTDVTTRSIEDAEAALEPNEDYLTKIEELRKQI